MLALCNRFKYQILCDRLSTDQFNDNIDFRMCHDFTGVIRNRYLITGQLPGFLQITVRNHPDDDFPASTAGDFIVGFGIAGDEKIAKPKDFAWSFDLAREARLRESGAGQVGGR